MEALNPEFAHLCSETLDWVYTLLIGSLEPRRIEHFEHVKLLQQLQLQLELEYFQLLQQLHLDYFEHLEYREILTYRQYVQQLYNEYFELLDILQQLELDLWREYLELLTHRQHPEYLEHLEYREILAYRQYHPAYPSSWTLTFWRLCHDFTPALINCWLHFGIENCTHVYLTHAFQAEWVNLLTVRKMPSEGLEDVWTAQDAARLAMKLLGGATFLASATPLTLGAIAVNWGTQQTLASLLGGSVSDLNFYSWILVKAWGCVCGGSFLLVYGTSNVPRIYENYLNTPPPEAPVDVASISVV